MKRTQDLFERAAADGEAYEFGKRAGTSEFKAILGLRLKVGQINLEAKVGSYVFLDLFCPVTFISRGFGDVYDFLDIYAFYFVDR
eukprot:927523-Amorphochlora_amoeboformis.AAC.1